MTSGGVVPGGNCRSWVWEMAVTCAMALLMSACGWKKYLYYRDPVQRLRLDVLDVIDQRGQGAFGLEDDAVRHFLRIEAAVVPNDADDRNIDIRENVGGRREDDQRPENQQQQRKYNEGIRPP